MLNRLKPDSGDSTMRWNMALIRIGGKQTLLLASGLVAVIAVACSSSDGTATQPAPANSPTPEATAIRAEPPEPPQPGTATATSDAAPEETATPVTPDATLDLTFEATDERRALRFTELEGWETDFDQKLVGLGEFISILNRDGIDPIDVPTFAPVSNAPSYMKPREPVIAVEINGDARAYPLAILMWHEIANDVVGGQPITVTFCPLCNTAISFDRVVDGVELTFGTTGKVRNSDLVMWDRQTQSWWQQITGEAIVGHYAGLGAELDIINSPIIAWESFAEQYPDGLVMERIFDEIGFPVKSYDLAPYAGYDSVDVSPFAFDGELDGRLPANLRVLTVELGDDVVAYPFTFLEDAKVLNDTIAGTDVAVFFDNGTLSAFFDTLDAQLTSGSTTMFSRELDGRSLTFEVAEDGIRDVETGSLWNLLGTAVDGELEGEKLEPVIHANHFWFAWAVFQPDTEIRGSLEAVTGPIGGFVDVS